MKVGYLERSGGRKNNLGLCSGDFRIFWDTNSNTWILANDFKMRKLRNQGYGRRTAEKHSHGHLRKKKHCKTIRDNILANKRTKSRDLWILGAYVRIADNSYKHYDWVCGLYESKKEKDKQDFHNVGYGKIHNQRT